ncbi:MAG: DUF177 domain-containing protein [Acidobacteriota bacterium]
MFIGTKDLQQEPRRVSVDMARAAVDGILTGSLPARVCGIVQKTRTGVSFRGDLTATVELQCARCCGAFSSSVHTEFSLIYNQPRRGASDESSGEIFLSPEDTHAASLDEKGQIDLEALVREQIGLALPMKPVCHEQCRGLCIRCGDNLNEGPCSCQSMVVPSAQPQAHSGLKKTL